jgi:hypothetical protein
MTLSVGASCNMQVKFTSSGISPVSGKIALNYSPADNSGDTTYSWPLYGNTANTSVSSKFALAALDQGSQVDFGNVTVGSSSSVIYKITNVSSSAAKFTSGSGMGWPAGPQSFFWGNGTSTDCGNGPTLQPGDSCTVPVVFKPSAPGSYSAYLYFSYTDPSNIQPGTVAIGISGTGN